MLARVLVTVGDVVRLDVDDDLVTAQGLVRRFRIVHRFGRDHVELAPELLVHGEEPCRRALPPDPVALVTVAVLAGTFAQLARPQSGTDQLARGTPRAVLVGVQRLKKRWQVPTNTHVSPTPRGDRLNQGPSVMPGPLL